ncbi:MAG TPA: hypothetical protein VFO55_12640 [Gemmatimonadaceae bacterium]|nr:hypothetical protein [Gemmatimonadaceae bacterium]
MTTNSAGGRRRRRVRAGLTLMEIVVVVIIILILSAALTPTLMGVLDRKRADAAKESLDALVLAISDMRADNQDWPGRLSHLARPITTADRNICGSFYSAGKVSNWAGPYVSRIIPTTGFPIGIGAVQDSLVREMISGNDSFMKIQVDGVAVEDALTLDRMYDNDGSAAGTVRWNPPAGDGLVTMFFLRPIRGC